MGYWAAFGHPVEEQIEPRWVEASPLTHIAAGEPPGLYITQSNQQDKIDQALAMAIKHGLDTSTAVRTYAKTHAEFNQDLGAVTDTSGYTADVLAFAQSRLQ